MAAVSLHLATLQWFQVHIMDLPLFQHHGRCSSLSEPWTEGTDACWNIRGVGVQCAQFQICLGQQLQRLAVPVLCRLVVWLQLFVWECFCTTLASHSGTAHSSAVRQVAFCDGCRLTIAWV